MSKTASALDRHTVASELLRNHFKCPASSVELAVDDEPSRDCGYFRFGAEAICFGKGNLAVLAHSAGDLLQDCSKDVSVDRGKVHLPFDPAQVIDNLRYEYYRTAATGNREEYSPNGLVRTLYYLVRPLMPVAFRKHLQRWYFRGWKEKTFPSWPVDTTVEKILERLLILSMRAQELSSMPFIWFWPDSASSCAVMTHDVETTAGRDFCSRLMDINDSFGIKSAFQVIPEKRYEVPQSLLDSIPARGFELNVHDLNHDGHLMKSREGFLLRAKHINEHGRRFKATGFRSAMLHRKLEWYDALEFSYDMSVPNVAHLDPQRGGCCTVFPLFNGNLLELPVTMTQDYSLFHILQDYSLDLWKEQIAIIQQNHGMMNFIVHPDYIIEERERKVYEALLAHLKTLEQCEGVWLALPGEVDRWWRQRSQMRLVKSDSGWEIEGEGRERARIAYATEQDGRLVFSFEEYPSREEALTVVQPEGTKVYSRAVPAARSGARPSGEAQRVVAAAASVRRCDVE